MKLTVGHLRALVHEAKVSASASYMRKERVREALQAVIVEMLGTDVKNDADLASTFKDVEMAVNALKMIPLDVWMKLRSHKKR